VNGIFGVGKNVNGGHLRALLLVACVANVLDVVIPVSRLAQQYLGSRITVLGSVVLMVGWFITTGQAAFYFALYGAGGMPRPSKRFRVLGVMAGSILLFNVAFQARQLAAPLQAAGANISARF
jgi:hypothetical protein